MFLQNTWFKSLYSYGFILRSLCERFEDYCLGPGVRNFF